MIALLSTTRFKVEYEEALGRPFSEFERFILEAVAGGHSSLERLHALFCVHRRVLIEGLVTLMQAGWLAMTRDGEFLTTKAGSQALMVGDSLPSTVSVESRVDFVLMERFGGQVARKGSILFYDRRKLKSIWDVAIRLPNGDLPPSLDPSVAGPLLSRDSHGWIRWINSVTPVRRGPDYVVLSVDTERGTVAGLPREWERLLSNEILDYVRRVSPQHTSLTRAQEQELETLLTKPASQTLGGTPQGWTLRPDEIQVRPISMSKNATYLETLLASSERHMVIAASELEPTLCKDFLTQIAHATTRGVRIDIIYTGPQVPSESSDEAIGVFRREAYNYLQQTRNIARLTFATSHRVPLNGVILGGPTGYTFFMQSHSILGPSAIAHETTVRHPGMLAEVCQIMSDAYGYENDASIGPAIVRLRTAASTLGAQMANSVDGKACEVDAGASRGEILRGVQLAAKFRECLKSAKSSLSIAVPFAPAGAVEMLRLFGKTLDERQIRVVIYMTSTGSLKTDPEVAEWFTKRGGEIRELPNISSSWLWRDDLELVVGTYNWLTPFAVGREETIVDLAVSCEGPVLVSSALKILNI